MISKIFNLKNKITGYTTIEQPADLLVTVLVGNTFRVCSIFELALNHKPSIIIAPRSHSQMATAVML